MRISTFIGLSSLLICSWLGVAFIREVPTGSYPVKEASFVVKPVSSSSKSLVVVRDEPLIDP